MPVVLAIFSILVQPAQLDRYAIPTLGAIPALLAPVLSKLNRVGSSLALVAFLLLSFIILKNESSWSHKLRENYSSSAESVMKLGSIPIVFGDRYRLYPLHAHFAGPRSTWYQFDTTELGTPISPLKRVMQVHAEALLHYYDLPKLVRLSTFPAGSEIALFGFDPSWVSRLDKIHRFAEIRPISKEQNIYVVKLR
jgi:hypothetical protein